MIRRLILSTAACTIFLLCSCSSLKQLTTTDGPSGAATVTASATADIIRMDAQALTGGDPVTNLIPVGTTSTGYTASGEGTPGTVRTWEIQFVAPTNQYVKQFPLGLEPVIQVNNFARIRVLAGSAVNAYCYMVVQV